MNFKKIVNGSWTDIPHCIYNTSTDTITTLPANLYADGTNATVGLVGNMQQTGVPTPQNPIQPQECGERTGNLFVFPFTDYLYCAGSGQNRTVTETTYKRASVFKIEPNTTYTFSGKRSGAKDTYGRLFLFDEKPVVGVISTHFYNFRHDSSITFTTESNEVWCLVQNDDASELDVNYQMTLNSGSTALPYEPYGIKIPISSGGTTTPVYLGEVETTRKIRKLVLDGTESIELNTVDKNRLIIQAVYTLPQTGTETATNIICTHLVTLDAGTATALQQGIAMRYNGTDMLFGIPFSLVGATTDDTNATIRTKVKSYLAAQYAASTPVCVWYVLATPTTGVVNEPLRKIGDYADTVSGISIPTITGKDTFDVETTLKPSEVSLAYTGWHDATVKEWDGSEWN